MPPISGNGNPQEVMKRLSSSRKQIAAEASILGVAEKK